MAGTELKSPGVAAEPDRVSVGPILKFAATLVFGSLLSMAAALGVFRFLERRTLAAETGPTPVEAEQPRTAEQKLPPDPRLEINEPADLARMRAEEDARLTSYAWVDKTAGVVRIPVERAMELLVEREKNEKKKP
jgi:hypothetical protein